MNLKLDKKSILSWLDENILLILSSFLLAFIPLWPKIPLFSLIEQYIVRVRAEDIFIALTGVIWLIQVYRRKIKWQTPIFYAVLFYGFISLLSLLNAMFVLHTIPLQLLHVGTSSLHFFRYLEYFSLLFILYSSIKNKRDLLIASSMIALTVIGVAIYGYGQKYFYWPVYSTMNREFSKGVRLYLTEHARVQSTFAGHYDLGGYLAISLPFLYSFFLAVKTKKLKALYALGFIMGLWILIISASRGAFGSFLIGTAAVLGLYTLAQQGWIKKIWYGFKHGLLLIFITGFMLINYGEDMNERFLQILAAYPAAHETYHYFNGKRKEGLKVLLLALIGKEELKAELPAGAVPLPTPALTTGVALTPTDTVPVPVRPTDVYVEVPDKVAVATQAADGTFTIIYEERERVFSDCAIKKSLSLCIRLEALWPMAINSLKQSPILGKGYATLNKEGNYQFTEADGTDNNYLRILGETGFLGFLSFFGIIGLSCYYALKHLTSQDALKQAASIAIIACSLGLLTDAVYIDVFAASKVAYSYWAIIGLSLAYLKLPELELVKLPAISKKKSNSRHSGPSRKTRK